MIKCRLSWGRRVYCGSPFLLRHIARYTKYNIFASYRQQFYFLLAFIQQNKSATTLQTLLAFRNITPELKKKSQPPSVLLCWVMVSLHHRRPDVFVFIKLRTSSAFRPALSPSTCHLELCMIKAIQKGPGYGIDPTTIFHPSDLRSRSGNGAEGTGSRPAVGTLCCSPQGPPGLWHRALNTTALPRSH